MLVLDTHVWVWLVGGDNRIRPDTLGRIEATAGDEGYVVPAIAVWEVAMLVERGRLTLTRPLKDWIEEALAQPGFDLAELSPAISIRAAAIDRRILSDPSDRMIVATAVQLGGVLATRDREIITFCKASGVEVLPT